MDTQETIEETIQNAQQQLKVEKDDYYAMLVRTNGVLYVYLFIVLFCFIAPKWFKTQKKEIQDSNKYDFYKE